MDIKKTIGEKVRKLREEQWFSQEGFARECGVHRTYMGLIERGKANISIENLEKIILRLNINFWQFFKWL